MTLKEGDDIRVNAPGHKFHGWTGFIHQVRAATGNAMVILPFPGGSRTAWLPMKELEKVEGDAG